MFKLTRKQAISLFCYECLGGEWGNEFSCTCDGRNGTTKCFLYDFPKQRPDSMTGKFFEKDGSRIGGDFFTAQIRSGRELSEEQKGKMKAGRLKAGQITISE